ncbi:MAG: serine protease, partial [Bryocella sp.]
WLSYTTTLLTISSFLTTAAVVLMFAYTPIPAIVNDGLPGLDERNAFVTLPTKEILSSSDASHQLKPLVIVVSPVVHLWNHQEVAAPELGAGALLFANKSGYLFATANHVVEHEKSGAKDAMVSTVDGIWSKARVIASAPDLDLSLLWVARHSGTAQFLQPIVAANDGEEVFVIGHPEGLKFTLSTGIVSGLRNHAVQVSAAISPGNSGGPVYDDHGNLIAIVSSKFDNNADANAENIGFATSADPLRNDSAWTFAPGGKQILDQYIAALASQAVAPPAAPEAQQK